MSHEIDGILTDETEVALDELLGCKHESVAESRHVDRSGGRLSHPGHLLHQGDLFG